MPVTIMNHSILVNNDRTANQLGADLKRASLGDSTSSKVTLKYNESFDLLVRFEEGTCASKEYKIPVMFVDETLKKIIVANDPTMKGYLINRAEAGGLIPLVTFLKTLQAGEESTLEMPVTFTVPHGAQVGNGPLFTGVVKALEDNLTLREHFGIEGDVTVNGKVKPEHLPKVLYLVYNVSREDGSRFEFRSHLPAWLRGVFDGLITSNAQAGENVVFDKSHVSFKTTVNYKFSNFEKETPAVVFGILTGTPLLWGNPAWEEGLAIFLKDNRLGSRDRAYFNQGNGNVQQLVLDLETIWKLHGTEAVSF